MRFYALKGLDRDCYAAVLLGIGLQGGSSMNIPGSDTQVVLDAIRFLRQVNLGHLQEVKTRAVVVARRSRTKYRSPPLYP